MKISLAWLKTWVPVKKKASEIAEQLTMLGLEVEAIEPAALFFSGLLIGKVRACEPHSSMKKLTVCEVDTGGLETLTLVCGDQNVRPEQKVAVAPVGSKIGELVIDARDFSGVKSQGMLCSKEELGLSEHSTGIWVLPDNAPIGEALSAYCHLPDDCLSVDLTPNRGDCLSVRGLARELSVVNDTPVQLPQLPTVQPQHEDVLTITLHDPSACPQYAGRLIRDINVKAPTPLWLSERLRRSGLRSIDPIVDVTNYVMLELGQPMHAFDAEKIDGGIHVRPAKAGEGLTLLDGKTITMQKGSLLIADDHKPLALAGVMGGAQASVSDKTRTIFLESAFFSPQALAGVARSYGLNTDSSHRYERGVDPALTRIAIERATALLVAIAGGEPGPVVCHVEEKQLPVSKKIPLRFEKVNALLGMTVSVEDVTRILTTLGFGLEEQTDDRVILSVPSYRFDINLEVDFIEEIARVLGLNAIPSHRASAKILVSPLPENRVTHADLCQTLVARGYREVINYSFVDPKRQAALFPEQTPIALSNPIASDMAHMRCSLWTGLLDAVKVNQQRQMTDLRLFELGRCFLAAKGIAQPTHIGGVLAGTRDELQWNNATRHYDFFDAKGDVEALLRLTGLSQYRFEAQAHPALHPGQSAAIYKGEDCVGWVGQCHPKQVSTWDCQGPIFLFELFTESVLEAELPRYQPLSKYQANRRDIAFLIDEAIPSSALINKIKSIEPEILQDVHLFDDYRGKGIPTGKKSLAIGLILQHPSHTLKEAAINRAVDNVIEALSKEWSIELRG